MRRICYISGTRADFGLMKMTLKAIDAHADLSMELIVTGMHLLPEYGETWREIVEADLSIMERVPVRLEGGSGADMALAMAEQLRAFTVALSHSRPDAVLVLGDRGEMLAGALAAIHLNIPVVHIHGGELSGTVDEPVRHAISKLSHVHLVASDRSRERLVRMGEKPEQVFVTGAPGLDEILDLTLIDKTELWSRYELDSNKPLLMMVYHPVVQQIDDLSRQANAIMDALACCEMQVVILLPNADAGGAILRDVFTARADQLGLVCLPHLPRTEYLSMIAHADVLVGNSSSGIIEAASLGTPVVNIGDRQRCR